MLMVNDVFVRFMIMKLKYILTTLIVEYWTFRIYMLLLIICIIVAKILSGNDADDFHMKSLGMQYSVMTASEGCSTERVK